MSYIYKGDSYECKCEKGSYSKSSNSAFWAFQLWDENICSITNSYQHYQAKDEKPIA